MRSDYGHDEYIHIHLGSDGFIHHTRHFMDEEITGALPPRKAIHELSPQEVREIMANNRRE